MKPRNLFSWSQPSKDKRKTIAGSKERKDSIKRSTAWSTIKDSQQRPCGYLSFNERKLTVSYEKNPSKNQLTVLWFPFFLSFDLITALITIEIKEIQTSGEVKGVIG